MGIAIRRGVSYYVGYFAKFYGRLFEFGYHTPFETGQQTFFDTLQQHWSAVGSQNELLAVLMQMIEDMEEVVLSLVTPANS